MWEASMGSPSEVSSWSRIESNSLYVSTKLMPRPLAMSNAEVGALVIRNSRTSDWVDMPCLWHRKPVCGLALFLGSGLVLVLLELIESDGLLPDPHGESTSIIDVVAFEVVLDSRRLAASSPLLQPIVGDSSHEGDPTRDLATRMPIAG